MSMLLKKLAQRGLRWLNKIVLEAPGSAAGGLEVQHTANTNSAYVTVTNASHAADRTYTIPDAGAAAKFQLTTQSGALPGTVKLPLMLGRTNTGLVLDATGGAGLFKVGLTPGMGLNLVGEAAQNTTKTDYVVWEFQLPPTYKAGSNLTASINASHVEADGTTLTNKIDVEAWEQGAGGTHGSDICATAEQAIGVTALEFTLTGTALVPGDVIVLRIKSTATEGGNTGTTTNYVNSVSIS